MSKINMTKKALTVLEAFEIFLNEKVRAGLVEASLKSYKDNLKIFFLYFDPQSECSKITKEVFEDYKDYLRKRQSNMTTANTYLRHLRAVLNFFMKQGYIQKFDMQLMKVDETIKEVYTDEELKKLLKKPDVAKCSFSEYRTWVIVNYIMATGNRILTIVNILNKDIHYEDKKIFLRHLKGRRQQYIPMSNELSKVLKEYQSYRGGELEDYLFCTEEGKKLSTSGLQTAMKRYCNSRGVSKTSEQLLRHTFAKLYYKNSKDIMGVHYMLGHKDINMTKHYINMLCGDIEDFSTNSPLDNLVQKSRIKMRK